MASLEFHHGSRVFQSGEEPVLAQFRDTSTVGLLVAIDPAELPSGKSFDTPFQVLKAADAATLPDDVKDHIDSIYDQTTTAVIVVLIDEGSTAAELMAAAVGDFTQKTGIHAFKKCASMGLKIPKLICAPGGLTTAAAADGVASCAVTTPGTNYSLNTTVTVAGDTGQGAVLTPVIGTGGVLDAIVVTKPGFGYTGALVVTITDPDGTGSGGAATATIGQVLNPVISEAQGVCETMRAVFYADGPDGTNEQAVQARQLIGHRRICFSDPRVLKSVGGVPYPKSSSAIYAGLQAKMDRERGPVYAGSNVVINGIQGVNRPVEYGEEANYLNENRVNTIINRGSGFRAWGVWTCASESIWQFIPVVRVSDLVNETIEEAFLEFNDRPQTTAQFDLMVLTGGNTLKRLENDKILLPGSAFWLAEENTPDEGALGIVKFGMRYEVPAPIVDIRTTAYRNIQIAYELLYDSVNGTVASGALIAA
jgi:hypothetical protein